MQAFITPIDAAEAIAKRRVEPVVEHRRFGALGVKVFILFYRGGPATIQDHRPAVGDAEVIALGNSHLGLTRELGRAIKPDLFGVARVATRLDLQEVGSAVIIRVHLFEHLERVLECVLEELTSERRVDSRAEGVPLGWRGRGVTSRARD
jgi:hypothetical protein